MIDPDDLGLEAVLYTVIGTVSAVVVAAVVVAIAAGRFGRRRFGPTSLVLALVVVVSVAVVGVVGWRTIEGSVTGWDLVWAVALAAVGTSCARLLLRRSTPMVDERVADRTG